MKDNTVNVRMEVKMGKILLLVTAENPEVIHTVIAGHTRQLWRQYETVLRPNRPLSPVTLLLNIVF